MCVGRLPPITPPPLVRSPLTPLRVLESPPPERPQMSPLRSCIRLNPPLFPPRGTVVCSASRVPPSPFSLIDLLLSWPLRRPQRGFGQHAHDQLVLALVTGDVTRRLVACRSSSDRICRGTGCCVWAAAVPRPCRMTAPSRLDRSLVPESSRVTLCVATTSSRPPVGCVFCTVFERTHGAFLSPRSMTVRFDPLTRVPVVGSVARVARRTGRETRGGRLRCVPYQ